VKTKKNHKKYILLTLVIIAIIGSIRYLEKANGDNQNMKKGAPEFIGIENWLNSDPITLEELKGKVVLVDFWTYSCINCIRTLPYITAWDEKYRESGLVVVGIHTPEFDFEKKPENVGKAIEKYNIRYPVGQDNSYATWNAFHNRYWPRKYLINYKGEIVYDHIGEGGYEETEKKIQEFLQERAKSLKEKIEVEKKTINRTIDIDPRQIGTPEIYLGYQFTRGNFGNKEGLRPEQTIEYTIQKEVVPNNVYLQGKWKNNKDNVELISNTGKILLIYQAKDLNIVAESNENTPAEVLLNTKPVKEEKGKDITKGGIAIINESRLYNLVEAKDYKIRAIEINFKNSGVKVYTFTFG